MTIIQEVTNIFFPGRVSGSATTKPYAIAPLRPPYAEKFFGFLYNLSKLIANLNFNLYMSKVCYEVEKISNYDSIRVIA